MTQSFDLPLKVDLNNISSVVAEVEIGNNSRFDWLMSNGRNIRQCLLDETISNNKMIRKNTADKSAMVAYGRHINLISSIIAAFERVIGLSLDYRITNSQVVLYEMFKFRLVDYEGLYQFCGLTKGECKIKAETEGGTILRYNMMVLFTVATYSLLIANPCVGVVKPVKEIVISLGWLENYQKDICSLFELDEVKFGVLSYDRQLVFLANAIFKCCSGCACYLDDDDNFVKEGNDWWSTD